MELKASKPIPVNPDNPNLNLITHSPEAWLETAKSVITPKDILPGTDSMSIQKETQDTATIKMEGR